jgi:phasin family protein
MLGAGNAPAEGIQMPIEVNELIEQQMKGLTELVGSMKRSRVAAARRAATESAARIKSINSRVRDIARSGVRLTYISNGAVQGLIELQADIVNSALTEAAEQIQRMAYTESVRDLAGMQAEVLQAARKRIVEDISRAVTILKDAAGDVRKVATASKAKQAAAPKKKRKVARRKTKVAAKTRTAAASRAKRGTRRRAKRKSRG